MTKVKYNPDKLWLSVEDHAGSAEKGKDLVCAAISALTNTLEAVFTVQEDMEGDFRRWETWEKGMEPGTHFPMIVAQIPEDSPLRAQGLVVMETIATGLLAMSEKFPEFVSFELVGEGEKE